MATTPPHCTPHYGSGKTPLAQICATQRRQTTRVSLMVARALRSGYDDRRMMAPMDWSKCPAVESIPGKVSGAWVFRGTRVPVSAIFENLKTSTLEEVRQDENP